MPIIGNRNPPGAGGRPRGGYGNNRMGGAYLNQIDLRLKAAPYSKRLDPVSHNSLGICTGSQAWTRAESPYWWTGRKLVLPFGEEPEGYRWPVAGRDYVVWGFGEPEPRERLVRLSVALVQAGAVAVHWSGQWALTVYPDSTSDARLIEGAALSQMPAPVFQPAGRVAA